VKDNLYTVAYAAILGTVCALLLTSVDRATARYKEANQRADRILNILNVLQVPVDQDVTPQGAADIFAANVREELSDTLSKYVYVPAESGGDVKAVAVAFEGPGLWGPIKGFLSLRPDMKMILGLTIYEQEETPGLGGEIGASWFTDQFRGRSIVDESGEPGIYMKPVGSKLAPNEVHAITGATMTCDKLQAMLSVLADQIVRERANHE
jgi:Na+-transporting NADH:ubiquinone oxidoreductase subunit C